MFLPIFILSAPTKYLNGKLKEDTDYAVFQRSFSKNNNYEDEGFIRFKTDTSSNTVLIVAIVVSLLVVVAVIAGGIFYRRRRNSARDEEDGEIPLKPRKRTLTNRMLGRGSGAFGKLRLQYPCHAVFNRGVSRSFQRGVTLCQSKGTHQIVMSFSPPVVGF